MHAMQVHNMLGALRTGMARVTTPIGRHGVKRAIGSESG